MRTDGGRDFPCPIGLHQQDIIRDGADLSGTDSLSKPDGAVKSFRKALTTGDFDGMF